MLTLYHKHLKRGIKIKKWKYDLIIEPLNEIIELNHRIEANGIYMTDIMLSIAKNPASQLERGQQKDGHYFCCKLPRHFPYHVLT